MGNSSIQVLTVQLIKTFLESTKADAVFNTVLSLLGLCIWLTCLTCRHCVKAIVKEFLNVCETLFDYNHRQDPTYLAGPG